MKCKNQARNAFYSERDFPEQKVKFPSNPFPRTIFAAFPRPPFIPIIGIEFACRSRLTTFTTQIAEPEEI